MTELTDDFDAQGMVREFAEKFDTSTDQQLWLKLIIEESQEVNEAIANLMKEMMDLLYVTAGYVNLGGSVEPLLDNPDVCTAVQWADGFKDLLGKDRLQETFRRIHASNLSKLGDDGKPVRRADGKILKGPNYKPPVLTDLVRL